MKDSSTDSGQTLGPNHPRRELRALARGSAVNFAGVVAANGAQFGLLLVLSRMAGQTTAGVFFEGLAAVRLMTVVALFGMDSVAVRWVAIHDARGNRPRSAGTLRFALGVGLTLSVVALAASYLAAPELARVFGAPEFAAFFRVMSLSIPLFVAETILIAATRGTGRMRSYALVDQVLDNVSRMVAVAVALALGFGLTGTAWAVVLASALTLSAAVLSSWRLVTVRSGPRVDSAHELTRYSSFQWLAGLLVTGLVWADSLLLGIWRSPSDVAVYSVSTRTIMLGMVFVIPIGTAMQPTIARLYELRDMRALEAVYSSATKWTSVAGAPAMIFLAVYSSQVLTALYGHQYARGATVLEILAVAQIVNAASGPCGQVVSMVGRSDLVFANSLAALALNIVLNVILIPEIGMVGAALAWAAAIILVNILRIYQVWRVLHVHPFHRWPRAVALALGVFAGAAVVASLGLDRWTPLVDVIAGALAASAAYAVALRTLGVASLATGTRVLAARGP